MFDLLTGAQLWQLYLRLSSGLRMSEDRGVKLDCKLAAQDVLHIIRTRKTESRKVIV